MPVVFFFFKQKTSAAFGKYESGQKAHSANLLPVSANTHWTTWLDSVDHGSAMKFSTGLHQIWI